MWPARTGETASPPAAARDGAPVAAAPDDILFSFFIVSDFHYRDERCRPFLSDVIRQIRQSKIPLSFGLITGDITAKGTPPQFEGIRAVLNEVGMPCYTVIGNNDYQKPARSEAYEKAFPDRLNYTLEHKSWHFVGLDSCDGAQSAAEVRPAALDFLDRCLAKIPPERPVVLFSHYPMDRESWAAPKNVDKVLARFAGRKLVAAVGAHTHAFAQQTVGNTLFLTLGCCSFSKPSNQPPAFVICHAGNEKLMWNRVPLKKPA